jgi:diguanylate cyclase (GGDEF)-like protein
VPTELQLSDVLSEFARTMVTDFPIQRILDRLVLRIVDILPVTAAGVTLISPGTDPRYVAASNASALRFEKLQTELSEGPCVAACQSDKAIAVPDLRSEPRFPNFAPRAVEAGLAAVFTFPLRSGDTQLGALDLYRDTPGELSENAMAAAQTLADVASAYLLNAQARSELEDASAKSRESALHDSLTGLPNRRLLLERIDHAFLRARRSGGRVALLYCDIDHFKAVNDLYGHTVGDELLVAVGSRLSAQLRPGDTVARLAGDEFVMLCEDLPSESELDVIAARTLEAMAEPFLLSIGPVSASASIGTACSGRSECLPDQLLTDADVAMYQAKRKGGSRHQVVDRYERRRVDDELSLQRDLRVAAERGELSVEYQPVLGCLDGSVRSVEALLRWEHPSRGLVSPATVQGLAERSGAIVGIGRWVLERACEDRRRMAANSEVETLAVSMGVSAHQIMSPGFSTGVHDILVRTGTDPALVTLEVTESVFARDADRALIVLTELKQRGLRIGLDDVGIDYSALSYLKRFPIDIVKIGKGVAAELDVNDSSRTIFVAIVDLVHALGRTVIAEGIETAHQFEEITELGCDAAQGDWVGRRMPADAPIRHRSPPRRRSVQGS